MVKGEKFVEVFKPQHLPSGDRGAMVNPVREQE